MYTTVLSSLMEGTPLATLSSDIGCRYNATCLRSRPCATFLCSMLLSAYINRTRISLYEGPLSAEPKRNMASSGSEFPRANLKSVAFWPSHEPRKHSQFSASGSTGAKNRQRSVSRNRHRCSQHAPTQPSESVMACISEWPCLLLRRRDEERGPPRELRSLSLISSLTDVCGGFRARSSTSDRRRCV